MVPAVHLFYTVWVNYGLGKIWPVAYFCKLNFIGIQACSFIFLLSVVAFTLSWQKVSSATQTIWPTKLKLFNIWNFNQYTSKYSYCSILFSHKWQHMLFYINFSSHYGSISEIFPNWYIKLFFIFLMLPNIV